MVSDTPGTTAPLDLDAMARMFQRKRFALLLEVSPDIVDDVFSDLPALIALARRAEAAERERDAAMVIVAQCRDIPVFAGADTDNGTWGCGCCYAVVGAMADGGEPDPDPMLHDAACVYRRAMEHLLREGGS